MKTIKEITILALEASDNNDLKYIIEIKEGMVTVTINDSFGIDRIQEIYRTFDEECDSYVEMRVYITGAGFVSLELSTICEEEDMEYGN